MSSKRLSLGVLARAAPALCLPALCLLFATPASATPRAIPPSARDLALVAPDPGKPIPGSTLVTRDSSPDALVSGEALCLRTPADPSLPVNGCFAIDLAGNADLPWVGRVAVDGRNPLQVEAGLMADMGERLRGSPLKVKRAFRLGFVGSWARPGEHYLAQDATLWDALLAAGGPAGTYGTVQIMRGGDLMLQVSLMGAYPKEARLRGVGIRSGDLFLLMPIQGPPVKSSWEIIKESLAVSAQLAAVMGSLLSAWLTWDILKKGGAI